MRVIDVNRIASEIVAVLEKHQLPVGYLEEVLDKVEETVLYFAPIKRGPVGRETGSAATPAWKNGRKPNEKNEL